MSAPRNEKGKEPRVIVVIGVSGSGKSTIGKLLAEKLDCPFYEGDDYHPQANRDKMQRGVALTDTDRWPWLAAIRELITETIQAGGKAVIACSALTRAYRDFLRQERVVFVYLKGDYKLTCERWEKRRGHFFDPELLSSQFKTLEEPQRAIVVDIGGAPEVITQEIVTKLGA